MRVEFPVGNQGLLTVEMCCEHPTLYIYILLAPGCGLLPHFEAVLQREGGCACTPAQSWDGFAAGSASAVPHRTDRRIPPQKKPQKTNGNCTQWFKKHKPTLHTPREHSSPLSFFGYQPRQPPATQRSPLSICDPYKKYNYMYHDKAICHLKIILIIHYTSYFTII